MWECTSMVCDCVFITNTVSAHSPQCSREQGGGDQARRGEEWLENKRTWGDG